MKCQHRHLQIVEFGTSTTTHYMSRYGTWEHDSDFGNYTGRIEVHCPDCHYARSFTTRRPKWVQQLLDEATEAERENGMR